MCSIEEIQDSNPKYRAYRIGDSFSKELDKLIMNNNATILFKEIYEICAKSEVFSEVKLIEANDINSDLDEALSDIIYVKSKLYGESDYHPNDLDEFEIQIIERYGAILINLHYIPSGSCHELNTIANLIYHIRCYEKI